MGETDPALFVCLLAAILAFSGSDAVAAPGPQHKLLQNLDTIHSNLQQLSRSIRSAHTDTLKARQVYCRTFFPMSDAACSAGTVDNEKSREEDQDWLVNSPLSPGKRTVRNRPQPVPTDKERVVEDLLRKQNYLQTLHNMVDDAKTTLHEERKRSCNVNLGFHCQTEHYSAVADMYNWLQSEMSPGKRRRRRGTRPASRR